MEVFSHLLNPELHDIIGNKKEHQPEVLQTEVLPFFESISRLILLFVTLFLLFFRGFLVALILEEQQ